MQKLNFCTAGIPISAVKAKTHEGLEAVKNLGLDGMEMEFVHSVYLKEEGAKLVNEARKKTGMVLTAHGPYYINLNSVEKPKIYASINRILQTARIAHLAGAFSITFHPAFYLKMDKETVYNNVKQRLKEIVKTLQDESNPILISPELTGKETQFGNLDELLKLSQEIEQVQPCIDFAHQHARYNGKYNTYEEFKEILTKVEKALGKESLSQMHMHASGINYGEKGEKNHLTLEDSDFNYKDLLKVLKEFKVKGSLVCESPVIEKDALLLKKTYEKL